VDCSKCIYRTQVKITRYKTEYNAIAERDTTFSIRLFVPACGKVAGSPLEIPENRVACIDCKESNN